MDGHSVKAPTGMVVQVVRSGGASTSAQQATYALDTGTAQGQRYVMSTPTSATGKRVSVQPQSSNLVGRTMAITQMQPRFVASSRLGTPQSAPSLTYGIKRPFTRDYGYEFNTARKFSRGADKSKGLRHFSTKVCEKVKEKGHTNYNEVADELVAEYFDSLSHPPGDSEKQQYDMKNIRRRVYDALNVLMAMNIIEKEKKEIRWVGLPTSSLQECRRLEDEKEKRQERIRQKAEQLQELIIQLVAYKSLVERNREKERTEGRPAENTVLYLPYIVVNTEKKTMIDCAISHDKSEYLFNFDQPFEIHDDIEVLKRLGLAHGLERAEVPVDQRAKVKACLPPALREYVDQILEGTLCGGIVGPSVRVQPTTQVAQVDRKSLMTSYTAAPPIRAGGSQSALASGVTRAYASGVQGGAYVAGMRAPQARYAVVPRVVPSTSAPGSSRYGTAVTSAYRGSPSSASRQYVVQQTGGMQQRTYGAGSGSRQQAVAYTIQAPGQSQLIQGQRYEEVYEEEDENVRYE
uniref:Transcription factor Dp-1 n=2 Tax=Ascaris TaxID=6251 RepID=A0A0M3I921_ASCLU